MRVFDLNWRRGLSRLFWSVWLIGWLIAAWDAVSTGRFYGNAGEAFFKVLSYFVIGSLVAKAGGRLLDWVIAGFRQ